MNSEIIKVTTSNKTVQAKGLLPFTIIIMEALMSNKSTTLVFEKYDGSTDPDEHLHSFVNIMAFYSSSDLVCCRAFSLLLKGEALVWYKNLPPNTVDYFAK